VSFLPYISFIIWVLSDKCTILFSIIQYIYFIEVDPTCFEPYMKLIFRDICFKLHQPFFIILYFVTGISYFLEPDRTFTLKSFDVRDFYHEDRVLDSHDRAIHRLLLKPHSQASQRAMLIFRSRTLLLRRQIASNEMCRVALSERLLAMEC
jgi:hypothetical protein